MQSRLARNATSLNSGLTAVPPVVEQVGCFLPFINGEDPSRGGKRCDTQQQSLRYELILCGEVSSSVETWSHTKGVICRQGNCI